MPGHPHESRDAVSQGLPQTPRPFSQMLLKLSRTGSVDFPGMYSLDTVYKQQTVALTALNLGWTTGGHYDSSKKVVTLVLTAPSTPFAPQSLECFPAYAS